MKFAIIFIMYVGIQGLKGQTGPQCKSSMSMKDGVCQFDTNQGTIDLSVLDRKPGPRYYYLYFSMFTFHVLVHM